MLFKLHPASFFDLFFVIEIKYLGPVPKWHRTSSSGLNYCQASFSAGKLFSHS